VSYKAEVPTVFGAIFSSVVVGPYPSCSVDPFQLIEFTNEGELSFEVVHGRDGIEVMSKRQPQ
jgi:hypothetical protein